MGQYPCKQVLVLGNSRTGKTFLLNTLIGTNTNANKREIDIDSIHYNLYDTSGLIDDNQVNN